MLQNVVLVPSVSPKAFCLGNSLRNNVLISSTVPALANIRSTSSYSSGPGGIGCAEGISSASFTSLCCLTIAMP